MLRNENVQLQAFLLKRCSEKFAKRNFYLNKLHTYTYYTYFYNLSTISFLEEAWKVVGRLYFLKFIQSIYPFFFANSDYVASNHHENGNVITRKIGPAGFGTASSRRTEVRVAIYIARAEREIRSGKCVERKKPRKRKRDEEREREKETGQASARVIYLIGVRVLFSRVRRIFSPCFSFGNTARWSIRPFAIYLRPFYTPLDLPASVADKHALRSPCYFGSASQS